MHVRYYRSKRDMENDNWFWALDEQGADIHDVGKGAQLQAVHDAVSITHSAPPEACYLWFRHEFILFFTNEIRYATTGNPVLRPFDRSEFGGDPVVQMSRIRQTAGLWGLLMDDKSTYKNDINRIEAVQAPTEEYRRLVEATVDLKNKRVLGYTFSWTVPSGVDTSGAAITKPAPFTY